MLTPLLTVATLFVVAPAAVRASACVAFDASWNLLAFDLDGKDWDASTQDQWASGMFNLASMRSSDSYECWGCRDRQ